MRELHKSEWTKVGKRQWVTPAVRQFELNEETLDLLRGQNCGAPELDKLKPRDEA